SSSTLPRTPTPPPIPAPAPAPTPALQPPTSAPSSSTTQLNYYFTIPFLLGPPADPIFPADPTFRTTTPTEFIRSGAPSPSSGVPSPRNNAEIAREVRSNAPSPSSASGHSATVPGPGRPSEPAQDLRPVFGLLVAGGPSQSSQSSQTPGPAFGPPVAGSLSQSTQASGPVFGPPVAGAPSQPSQPPQTPGPVFGPPVAGVGIGASGDAGVGAGAGASGAAGGFPSGIQWNNPVHSGPAPSGPAPYPANDFRTHKPEFPDPPPSAIPGAVMHFNDPSESAIMRRRHMKATMRRRRLKAQENESA
ncbi:hypothetical protein V493_08214, partial [Pseudogymnoascus sp. VKM F-4281 (FW-2241)]